jgi:hypothetical protein
MVPAHLDVEQGYKIASAIEYEIELALGEGNATAHIEPCATQKCDACHTGASAISRKNAAK